MSEDCKEETRLREQQPISKIEANDRNITEFELFLYKIPSGNFTAITEVDLQKNKITNIFDVSGNSVSIFCFIILGFRKIEEFTISKTFS